MKSLALLALLLTTACASVPPPPPQPPTPPGGVRAIAVIVTDGEQRLVGATVLLEDVPTSHVGATGVDGVITFPQVTGATQQTNVHVSLPGCQPYLQPALLTANLDQQIDIGGPLTTPNAVVLPPLDCGVDPSIFTLEQLARIRGAMWPEAVKCEPDPSCAVWSSPQHAH